MKKINCPCCGKELINLAAEGEYPRFWCDDCKLDIGLSTDAESLVSIESHEIGLRVDWVNLGEGICGDYNPENPEDVNLLRFDVYWEPDKDTPTDEMRDLVEWEEVEDSSYCTRVPADTPEDELIRLCYVIFKRYAEVIGDYPYCSVKKLGEELSWIEPRKDRLIRKVMYAEPRKGGSLTGNLVEIIGEQTVEHNGRILEQYLYNIVGYTPSNGLPFVALKSNICLL